MANRDESHLFSLAALTTRAPAPLPGPPATDDEGSVAFQRAPEHSVSALGAGFSVFPLGAPLGNHAPLAPSALEAARPKPGGTGRGRTLALVALASLLGAAIVFMAVWSSRSAEPNADTASASLARPEVLTQTLVPPPPSPHRSPALAPLPAPAPPVPEPAGERTSGPESQSGPHAAQPTPRPRPRPKPNADPTTTRPAPVRTPAATPAPARGACAHCSPHDLACNIKCRAN